MRKGLKEIIEGISVTRLHIIPVKEVFRKRQSLINQGVQDNLISLKRRLAEQQPFKLALVTVVLTVDLFVGSFNLGRCNPGFLKKGNEFPRCLSALGRIAKLMDDPFQTLGMVGGDKVEDILGSGKGAIEADIVVFESLGCGGSGGGALRDSGKLSELEFVELGVETTKLSAEVIDVRGRVQKTSRRRRTRGRSSSVIAGERRNRPVVRLNGKKNERLRSGTGKTTSWSRR